MEMIPMVLGRICQVVSLQDAQAWRNRKMVGPKTLLGSSPLHQHGWGILDIRTKQLVRGSVAEKERGKRGIKICI